MSRDVESVRVHLFSCAQLLTLHARVLCRSCDIALMYVEPVYIHVYIFQHLSEGFPEVGRNRNMHCLS